MKEKNKALFLDRDGVINIDRGFVHRTDDVELVAGIGTICRTAREKGFHIIVVSNQSGIGRGIFSIDDLERTNTSIQELLRKESGVTIDAWFICSHAPSDNCNCRKPKPTLFLSGIETYHLEPGECIAIGDKPSDSAAALSAGIGTVYQIRGTYWSDGDGIDPRIRTIDSLLEVEIP